MNNFEHSCYAILDARCRRLVNTLGYVGYGLYWGLIETLLQSDERSFPLDRLPQLASRLHVHTKTLRRVVTEFDLFDVGDAAFQSKPDGLYLLEEGAMEQ